MRRLAIVQMMTGAGICMIPSAVPTGWAIRMLFDDEEHCCGVLAWQLETGELHCFRAHQVILATGGFGQAFASTTASTICTGDGNAMVLRAGLPLQDMEFVQFHPTGLYG